MSSRTVVGVLLPDEPIPWVRIARFAVLALVILAAGFLCASLVHGVLSFFGEAFEHVGRPFARMWYDLVDLIWETLRAFAALVALGVFLTQFEFGGERRTE